MTRADGAPAGPHRPGRPPSLPSAPVYRQNRLAYSPSASIQANCGDHRRRGADPPDGRAANGAAPGAPRGGGVVYVITKPPTSRDGAPARLTHLCLRANRNVS
jgi:hypothetical protein